MYCIGQHRIGIRSCSVCCSSRRVYQCQEWCARCSIRWYWASWCCIRSRIWFREYRYQAGQTTWSWSLSISMRQWEDTLIQQQHKDPHHITALDVHTTASLSRFLSEATRIWSYHTLVHLQHDKVQLYFYCTVHSIVFGTCRLLDLGIKHCNYGLLICAGLPPASFNWSSLDGVILVISYVIFELLLLFLTEAALSPALLVFRVNGYR